jgi:very-short-patch-repair endonuclease
MKNKGKETNGSVPTVRDYSELQLTRVPSRACGQVKIQNKLVQQLRTVLKRQFRSYSRRQFLSKQWFLRKRSFLMRINRTFEEARLWHQLSRYQLLRLKFKSQVIIGNYIADFVCEKVRLIIEVDGNHHYDDPDVVFKDRQRTEYLNGLEYTVLRFPNREIRYQLNRSLAQIWDYCAEYLNGHDGTRHVKNPYHNKRIQLRLCDLESMTGIPKSTIQYYRKQGLLYTEDEQKDRSKIPSRVIQYYTLEHFEKLMHVHSMRVKLDTSSREMLYLFRCIEQAVILAQSPEEHTPEEISHQIDKIQEKYFIPPKKPIRLKDAKYGLPLRDFPSTLRQRFHVYRRENPYRNTMGGELQKVAFHRSLMSALGEVFTQQQEANPHSGRFLSPLGSLFERFLQIHYETPNSMLALFLSA